MVEVQSAAIERIDYDPAQRLLSIAFRHGGRYFYHQVPRSVAAGLMKASSHGRYFAKHIRDRYDFTEAVAPAGCR